jgi:signal transduction histidine kinase/ActR/RegA family two-component response regulator
MKDFFRWMFSSESFLPHGHCYLWHTGTLWLNVGSDALIAASYFAIPLALYYFVRRRKNEIAYAWVPLMFAAFILLCGATHVMEIWTVWNPIYRVAGGLKLVTGLVSFGTVVMLVWIMPRVMLLQTPRQLHAEVTARTSELALLNAQLRNEVAARAAAEERLRLADRRKDEFLATLAHELRNPLAPIRHSLKLLDATGIDETKRQWGSKVISRQVQRMALLLDDLLDVSRIATRRFDLKIEPVDLGTLITSAVDTAVPLMEERRHAFQVNVPTESVIVEVDPLRLSQAIANLLSNAAKYTPPGGRISLTVHTEGDALIVTVADSGIGFQRSSIPAMFEMFTRITPELERGESGLGIGLALVKHLVALHGGTVEVNSDGEGRGSEFTLRVPGAVPAGGGPAAATATLAQDSRVAPASIAKVLVIDDNRDSADALTLVLQEDGHQVTVGYSGSEAMELAGRVHPDAVFLDIGMPDISGYDVARRLRREPWGRGILLVAMTGWGQPKDKELAQSAGFDRHFTKPIDPTELQTLLAAFIQARRSPPAAQPRGNQ